MNPDGTPVTVEAVPGGSGRRQPEADRTMLGSILVAWLGALVLFLALVPIVQAPIAATMATVWALCGGGGARLFPRAGYPAVRVRRCGGGGVADPRISYACDFAVAVAWIVARPHRIPTLEN